MVLAAVMISRIMIMIIMRMIMMIMRMKHYGFRSGNDIKAGGFCTGTNDQEKQEA